MFLQNYYRILSLWHIHSLRGIAEWGIRAITFFYELYTERRRGESEFFHNHEPITGWVGLRLFAYMKVTAIKGQPGTILLNGVFRRIPKLQTKLRRWAIRELILMLANFSHLWEGNGTQCGNSSGNSSSTWAFPHTAYSPSEFNHICKIYALS